MNEEEWLTATNPRSMLEFLKGDRRVLGILRVPAWLARVLGSSPAPLSERKLRLFACACCRSLGHLMFDPTRQYWVEVVERFADGVAQRSELVATYQDALAAFGGDKILDPASDAALSTCFAARDDAAEAAELVSMSMWSNLFPDAGIYVDQPLLLRDIFGNPFRPANFAPSWRTPTVTSVAQAIYEERQLSSGLFDNQRMSVLADALEEAGCDNADILGHLRGSGAHVRGCWAVDLILGKG